ncbi:cytochrome b/b6 domain-containing protein [Novosphingobium tardum]|uniref:Cytochrome b/b6 domain-containing protein n=1 Tax=Novosphingobium tardum TaxID=1538021 RepID=A0ABV8RSH2_9SPHN
MKRHALSTRLWHWLNAWAMAVLFFSGLGISNAHPRLYLGAWGFDPATAWLEVPRFPFWMTIPGHYSLAEARLWHFLAAWPFALGLALFLVAALASGHWRRFVTHLHEWRLGAIREDLVKHLRRDFAPPPGESFNFLQKLLYGLVLFIGLPLMILTGLAMSPAMDAAWPWLLDLFAGRQTARSIHFVTAWALFAFFLAHILAVLLSGPIGQLRDMITGGKVAEPSAPPIPAEAGA